MTSWGINMFSWSINVSMFKMGKVREHALLLIQLKDSIKLQTNKNSFIIQFVLFDVFINLVCLVSSQGTFIFSIIKYTPLKFSNSYVYPLWANVLGWFFATVSLSLIPLFVLFKLIKGQGTLRQVSMISAKA